MVYLNIVNIQCKFTETKLIMTVFIWCGCNGLLSVYPINHLNNDPLSPFPFFLYIYLSRLISLAPLISLSKIIFWNQRQAGPHLTHSSDFIIWTWTLPHGSQVLSS